MAEITYFDAGGEQNTEAALKIALTRYQQGGIDGIVLASSFGESAQKAAQIFAGSGAKLLIVGEVLDGRQSPPVEVCEKLAARGHQVLWGTPFSVMSSFTRDQTAAVIADAYRRVSEGFKVVCEIVLIATSQGYLQAGQKVLAIAGTHRGSDTVVVASAASFSDFKDFEINEILCKPYQRSKH
jgi:hypothetical protein